MIRSAIVIEKFGMCPVLNKYYYKKKGNRIENNRFGPSKQNNPAIQYDIKEFPFSFPFLIFPNEMWKSVWSK